MVPNEITAVENPVVYTLIDRFYKSISGCGKLTEIQKGIISILGSNIPDDRNQINKMYLEYLNKTLRNDDLFYQGCALALSWLC